MAKVVESRLKLKQLAEPHPMPVDALAYPRFAGIATFMRLPNIADPNLLDVALIGVPYDGGTTYRTGPRFGPRRIREQSAIIRPYHPVLDLSPFERLRVADYGDLSVNPISIEDTFQKITEGLAPVLEAGTVPICVGGDHSILAAHSQGHPRRSRSRWPDSIGRALRHLGSILGYEVFPWNASPPRHRRGIVS